MQNSVDRSVDHSTIIRAKAPGMEGAMDDNILRNHDDVINVYKDLVRGTSFKSDPPLTAIRAGRFEHLERDNTMAMAGRGETVLLAEDDETLRKLNSIVLRHFGYSVVEAADGQEAVEKFIEQKNDINLLVLDVVMPRKSGKEAYREIVALHPGIKAIILSGLTRKSVDLPENGLLFSMKPIMPMDLARSVRQLLDIPAGKGRPNA